MTFDFDVALWLMGRPSSLQASAAWAGTQTPGDISALLAWDDGRHATMRASGLMPVGVPFSSGYHALFERAALEFRATFDRHGPPATTFTIARANAPPAPVIQTDRNPYEVELQRFADCITGRADPALLDADRAIEALELSLALQRTLTERHLR